MSIINDALKKTQQRRKMEKEKRDQQTKMPPPSSSTPPTSTLKPQPIETKNSARKKNEPEKKAEFLVTWKMASFLTVAALLAILALTNYQRNHQPSSSYAQAVQAGSKAAEKVKVAFEGVFVTDNARIALINKQSLHLGDSVNGMKIVAINQDTVDLQTDAGVLQLRAGATYLL